MITPPPEHASRQQLTGAELPNLDSLPIISIQRLTVQNGGYTRAGADRR
jgi:hypothetical protein